MIILQIYTTRVCYLNQAIFKGVVDIMIIEIEGASCAGKTTHSEFIKKILESYVGDIFMAKEPSESVVGKYVRKINNSIEDPLVSACLFLANRMETVREYSESRMSNLLSDRFCGSTIVYQFDELKLSKHQSTISSTISKVKDIILSDGMRPDLSIILDAPIDCLIKRSIKRMKEIGRGITGPEKKESFKHYNQKIIDKYIEYYLNQDYCWDKLLINAEGSIKDVERRIEDAIGSFFVKE